MERRGGKGKRSDERGRVTFKEGRGGRRKITAMRRIQGAGSDDGG